MLRDHLGSADVIVRPDGTVEETLSFDAHGRRRNASTYAYLLSYTDITTRRGYTGHEHLDALATLRVSATRLHMNARIYDPERSEVSVANVGRFLQADTLIEADATQGLNRYTYVLNNALTHTDPTGRLSTAQRMFLTAVAWVLTPHVTSAFITAGYDALTVYMSAGFVNGSISGGLKGGVIGAFSAGLFHGIGSTFTKEITPWAFTGGELNIAGRMAKIAAHGTAAGVTEMLRGGKFGHGFVSAATPELLHPQIGKLPSSPVRILSAALVGGSVSSATGGKFASGAVTAAFMWTFNHESENNLSAEEQEIAIFAKETIEEYNPLSIESNREYGGLIYRLDGRLYSTEPIISSPCLDDCTISFGAAAALVPEGAIVVADWHTHGASTLWNL